MAKFAQGGGGEIKTRFTRNKYALVLKKKRFMRNVFVPIPIDALPFLSVI